MTGQESISFLKSIKRNPFSELDLLMTPRQTSVQRKVVLEKQPQDKAKLVRP